MKKFWALFIFMTALIVLDQIVKGAILARFYLGETYQVIPGFFSLAYVQNTGAAFGFGQGGPEWFRQIFFLALPVLFCGWIFYLMIKTIKGPLLLTIAYSLIIAGAIGNLIDRFRLGFVVDMFMFYWKDEAHHFDVFNVADSCITIAATLLIIDYFRTLKSKKHQVQQG